MSGFVPVDPSRCTRYALFASHLERHQFDPIYWTLFVFNLFVLFCAAYGYTRCLERVDKLPEDSPKRKKAIVHCIYFILACLVVSLVTVVMQAVTLLALQFCDGEDLISLYWSTWTMIQVGSLIAVSGIILALLHTLRERKHPPWALALGTPVLVLAGLFSFLHSCISRRVTKVKDKAISRTMSKDSSVEDGTLPMSQVNTIRVDQQEDLDDIEGAELIGLTLQGGAIIHFKHSVPYTLPRNTDVIGHCENDKPIVVCRKEGFQFIVNGQKPSTGTG